ncbi:hypothetical protein QJQ45_015824, partial [Haematococcus lacustris]
VANQWIALLPDPSLWPNDGQTFAQVVHTDGVTVSLLFTRPKPAGPPDKLPHMGEQEGAVNPLAHLDADWLGCDPGKTNMATVAHEERYPSGAVESYYRQSGITQHAKTSKAWMAGIQAEHDVLSQVSHNTTSLQRYREYGAMTLVTWPAMWAEQSNPRWSNARFRLCRYKQSTVAELWAETVRGAMVRCNSAATGRPLALAYGAAGFSGSGSMGNRGVPVKQMLREACKQFPGRVVLVHEFGTSRVSSARTNVVAGQAESFRFTRGLKRRNAAALSHTLSWSGIRPYRISLYSKSHPYKRQGGQAARCACCVRSTPAGSTGWVEIHVEGEAAFYSSGRSHTAIGQVTAMMSEVIRACSNLVPQQVPLAHRTCAEAAAAAHAVGQQLRGQEPASQLQPMSPLCSTPTQAPAQPGPAHAPCPHHLPDQPPSHLAFASWMAGIQAEHDVLSQVSHNTTSLQRYREYGAMTLVTWPAMWAEQSNPRWSNARFRLCRYKQSTVAELWAETVRGAMVRCNSAATGRPLALAYGAAGFSGSGSMGNRGVPVKQMLREACKQFPGRVVLVHEFGTSRVSSARTNVVAGQAESFRFTRGLKRRNAAALSHTLSWSGIRPYRACGLD